MGARLCSILLCAIFITMPVWSTDKGKAEDGKRQFNKYVSLNAQEHLISVGNSVLKKVYNNPITDMNEQSYFENFMKVLLKEEDREKFSKAWAKSPIKGAQFANSKLADMQLQIPMLLKPISWICTPLTKFTGIVYWFLSDTSNEYTKKRLNYFTTLLAITYFAYAEADKKKQYFERGAFIINDPDGKVASYFHGYLELVTGLKKPGEKYCMTTTSNLGYARGAGLESSHFKNQEFQRELFGMDPRLCAEAGALQINPNEHAHTHFGTAIIEGKQYFFLKTEPAGMGLMLEFGVHSKCFASGSAGVTEESRRERAKDIPEQMVQAYMKTRELIEENEKKVATHLYEMWNYIFTEAEKSEHGNYKEILKQKKVFEMLAKKKGLDALERRLGKEVALDFKRFVKKKKIRVPRSAPIQIEGNSNVIRMRREETRSSSLPVNLGDSGVSMMTSSSAPVDRRFPIEVN